MNEANAQVRTKLDSDLATLTATLDQEVRAFSGSDTRVPLVDDKVVFAAAPEAIATAAIGICAGAIWLASVLPY